jgi:hypothetical protein
MSGPMVAHRVNSVLWRFPPERWLPSDLAIGPFGVIRLACPGTGPAAVEGKGFVSLVRPPARTGRQLQAHNSDRLLLATPRRLPYIRCPNLSLTPVDSEPRPGALMWQRYPTCRPSMPNYVAD